MSKPTTHVFVLTLAMLTAVSARGMALQQSQAPAPGEREAPTVDEVVVVTASRQEEELLNAPATMTVLTADVIGRAPVQSVTDLLRLVPGLNTVQTSARDVNVTSRAATGTLADSMLVLLDGRSIYQDFFGFVAWDFLPIDVQEIKQIEVIRGPASAVWGANAMTGVINVISKTPRQIACELAGLRVDEDCAASGAREIRRAEQGTGLALRFGQFNRSLPDGSYDGGGIFSLSATHAAATSDRFAYKVSAGLMTQEPFQRPTGFVPDTKISYPTFENQGTTQPRLDARADYELEKGRLIIAGGIAGTEGIVHTGLGPLDVLRGTTFKYGRITYTREKLKLQVFVNALDGASPPLLPTGPDGLPPDFRFENQAYDIEFSNQNWNEGGLHIVSYGGNYRHNNFDLSFATGAGNRDEGGAYVQDQIVFSEQYRLVVGGRVDRFDVLARAVFSPHTTFLIKPTPKQSLRVSFNRAFRAPSFVNSFLETALMMPVANLDPYRFPTVAVGDEHLKPEMLTAYEVAYIGRFGGFGGFGDTTVGAAAYLNHTRDAISFTQSGYYTKDNPPTGWPLDTEVLDDLILKGAGLPTTSTYENLGDVSDYGLELSIDTRINTSLTAFANYTWQADPKPTVVDISELNLPPRHRLNVGASVTGRRFFGSVSGSFVDSEKWQDVFLPYHGTTKAYTLFDGGVGVHSNDRKMTVAVRGTNLLNRPVQQHVFGDIIRRAVTGEVRFEF